MDSIAVSHTTSDIYIDVNIHKYIHANCQSYSDSDTHAEPYAHRNVDAHANYLVQDAYKHTSPHVDSFSYAYAAPDFNHYGNIDKHIDANGQFYIHAHAYAKPNTHRDVNAYTHYLVEDAYKYTATHLDTFTHAHTATNVYIDIHFNQYVDAHCKLYLYPNVDSQPYVNRDLNSYPASYGDKNCDRDGFVYAFANAYTVSDRIFYIDVYSYSLTDEDTHKNRDGFRYAVSYSDSLANCKQDANPNVYSYGIANCIVHTLAHADCDTHIHGHGFTHAFEDTDDHADLYAEPDPNIDSHAHRDSNPSVCESGCLFHRQ